jgi:exosortase
VAKAAAIQLAGREDLVSIAAAEVLGAAQQHDVRRLARFGPALAAAVAFAVLFAEPFQTLLRDWWQDPEAGHGLLLGPLAIWLAWRAGLVPKPAPQRWAGAIMLTAAVLVRSAAGLAAELFTMRLSMIMALAALVIFVYGWKQVIRWWLPFALLVLAIPLPAVLLSTMALPLQLVASKIGAALLEWRYVPVRLAGNIIYLPGQALFVTEACSGLRSLTALISLGLLLGAFWLRSPWLRLTLTLLAIPIALLLNSIRVFVTGFVVYFVSPAAGEGIMHYSEGWALFLIAFAALNVVASGLAWSERNLLGVRT